MQVIPNAPHPESTGSERQVLKLLRNVDWGGGGARALNSLNLPHHAYQRWGEIDFLVIGTPGLIAIEVKGGSVSCSGGYWRYEDRTGRVVTRSKSPVVQAKDAFFSLVGNYVGPLMGESFARSVPSGFCTVLAGASRAELSGLLGTPELPHELVGTREDVANPSAFGAFLRRVAMYWQRKNGGARVINGRDVSKLIAFLRPEFDQVRALALSSEQAKEDLLRLTEEQYEALDHWEGAERILCAAPAGCGKTLLAVELFRRARREGGDAFFVCGASKLAGAIARATNEHDRVVSLQELAAMRQDGRLPKAGILIVDEGQQALSPDSIGILDEVVAGGIDHGRWAWFGDPNHQVPFPAGVADEALMRLKNAATVQPKLRKNCRNTPEIVKFAELASGTRIGHAIAKGRGLAPCTVEADGAEALAAACAGQVSDWVDQGVEPSDICILTHGSDAAEAVDLAARRGCFQVSPWGYGAPPISVRQSDADEFRGLESPFLVLLITGFEEDEDALAKLLYVATTRANFGLTVVAPVLVIERLRSLVEKSLALDGGQP